MATTKKSTKQKNNPMETTVPVAAEKRYVRAAEDVQHTSLNFSAGELSAAVTRMLTNATLLRKDFEERNLPNKVIGKGIINDALNKLPLPEIHLYDRSDTTGEIERANFVGPYTQLDRRLKDFNPRTCDHSGFVTQPINNLDRAAYAHDIAYCKSSKVADRNMADNVLERAADTVISDKKSDAVQRTNARFVKGIMAAKQKLRA